MPIIMHQQIIKICMVPLAVVPLLLLLLSNQKNNLGHVKAFIPAPALKSRSSLSSLVIPNKLIPSLQRIPFLENAGFVTTALDAKKKRSSMAEKRKKRARRLPPRQVQRPAVLENDTPIDKWEPTTATGVITKPPPQEQEEEQAVSEEQQQMESEEEQKAKQLIESQRKSVETLTYVREKVESLPYKEIAAALVTNDNRGYYVLDNFLGDELASEIISESTSLLNDADKLELDLTHIGSGEYVTEIKGGQDQYADCPRCVEYVVSLTRFMPPLLDAEKVMGELQTLDATASMASLRVFDRKARLSSLELLSPGTEEPPRPFGYANGGDDGDARKVTVLYFLTPNDWTDECGGGVTVRMTGDEESGEDSFIEAKKDRLVIFRSDTCLLRLEAWKGTDELMNGGCLATHLVKART